MGHRAHHGWLLSAGLVAAPVVVVSWFRAVPAPWPPLVVKVVAFTPWLAFLAAAAVLLALPSRRAWAILPAAILLTAQLTWLFPPEVFLARQGGYPQVRGPDAPAAAKLTVMNLNARLGGADSAAIVRLVRDHHVDLLTVQEHSPELEKRLARADLGSVLPHRVSHPRNGAAGSAVYSSFRLKEVGMVPDTAFSMPVVRLETSDPGAGAGAGLTVINVHAHAPVDIAVHQWRSDLTAVARASSGAGPTLLAGDFNATYDHWEFRAMLEGAGGGRKLVDVATALGSRLIPTWPMRDYSLPGVALDHLVTSPDILSSGYSVHPVRGTDHAAVIATLEIQLP
ncbi:endonuclease/exonuclease/phosphatase family protein [Pseudarthrobacter sp. MDT3-28]|uniref:endonuclease/exonuclease/phosphatase family protein n=1 Tax=Pseudarthrobacter raffinosi TaxID=2953651 RepID=UPI00208F5B86|nr:endonuclease/exonuclease/phosphatase family protein [Pseudarthrobacter sp. MDT3-28]MCO4237205.1 endonuclease/exonuclease/phosphatase family protein [Pseudarthrobacter sp. MDT3-28]